LRATQRVALARTVRDVAVRAWLPRTRLLRKDLRPRAGSHRGRDRMGQRHEHGRLSQPTGCREPGALPRRLPRPPARRGRRAYAVLLPVPPAAVLGSEEQGGLTWKVHADVAAGGEVGVFGGIEGEEVTVDEVVVLAKHDRMAPHVRRTVAHAEGETGVFVGAGLGMREADEEAALAEVGARVHVAFV